MFQMTPATTTAAPAATRTIKVDINNTAQWEKFNVLTFEVPSSISDDEFKACIEEAADNGELEDRFDVMNEPFINGMKCVEFDEGAWTNEWGFSDTHEVDDISEVKAD